MDIKQILIQNNITPLLKQIPLTDQKLKINQSLELSFKVNSFITQFKNEISYAFLQKCNKHIQILRQNLRWCKEQMNKKVIDFEKKDDTKLNIHYLKRTIMKSDKQLDVIYGFHLCQLYMLIIEIGYHFILSKNDSIRLIYANIVNEFDSAFPKIKSIDMSLLYPDSLKSYRQQVKETLFDTQFQMFCLDERMEISSSIHTSFRDILYRKMRIDRSQYSSISLKLDLYVRYIYQFMNAPYMNERNSIQFNPRSTISMKEIAMMDKDIYINHSHIQEFIKYINQRRINSFSFYN